MRTAENGNAITFHFCPTCGSIVFWEGEGFPGYVAVAIGSFADPNFRHRPSRCGRSRVTPGSRCRPIRRPSAWRSRGDVLGSWPMSKSSGMYPPWPLLQKIPSTSFSYIKSENWEWRDYRLLVPKPNRLGCETCCLMEPVFQQGAKPVTAPSRLQGLGAYSLSPWARKSTGVPAPVRDKIG
jgi:Glutathione-dependent formaldehyde-activating enzyme